MQIRVHSSQKKDHLILMLNATGQMPVTFELERSEARELIMKLDNKITP